ncbi:NACHT domain-containing protein [Longispora sp. NPDC051575]|uniref:NACHT domain-containing protein n=1 Tax=Longispora sp. NPDC051575 TaxID=3154943 RepID=UPI00343D773D
MSFLAAGAFVLGTAITKAACSIWLGDVKLIESLGHEIADEAVQRLRTSKEKRQFKRILEQTAERVADRIERLVEQEFAGLPENEKSAAIDAVVETLRNAQLTDEDLFKTDLDAGFLFKYLLSEQGPTRWGLSAPACQFYQLVLRESARYLIEVTRALPGSGMGALEELLRRETQVLALLQEVLDRLPASRGVYDFEADYKQLVAHRLDRIEFFGASLSEASRKYPLSVAYLNLQVSGELLFDEKGGRSRHPTTASARAEDALAASRRLFVRGQAGIGKTTLLQWIAVHSARRGFSAELQDWRDTVPFFLPLRRYAAQPLPRPEEFIADIGGHILEEMPARWTHRQLREGRAIVLIDGVDELAPERRDEVRTWLSELVTAFPDSRYVITSRPAAVPADWLGTNNFDVAELEPMTAEDTTVFVRRWHAAMRDDRAEDTEECAQLLTYESNLLAQLDRQSHLRRLASYPLLCALLCALHRDHQAQLPDTRMELYSTALTMLLDRRDKSRGIDTGPEVSVTKKTLLLQELAFWLILNDYTEAPIADAARQMGKLLTRMAGVGSDGAEMLRYMLERSGLLREPAQGRLDFVHRTFQEYLAAKAAVDDDHLGLLINNAHLDNWREVIVLAAGHASKAKRSQLLRALIDRADRDTDDRLLLVCVACLETSPELAPEIRGRIEAAAQRLLPPRTRADADVLVGLGEMGLDLLATATPNNREEFAHTISVAGRVGGQAGLSLIESLSPQASGPARIHLMTAWRHFESAEYARRVLRSHTNIEISRPEQLAALPEFTRVKHVSISTLRMGSRPELGVLRTLPHLRSLALRVEESPDLTEIADLPLEILSVLRTSRINEPSLDLSSLAKSSSLRHITVNGLRTHGLMGLTHATSLERLQLSGVSVRELAHLTQLTGLRDVRLTGASGLTTLHPLSFLTTPESLKIHFNVLDDISSLVPWHASLRYLAIDVGANTDLSPLAELRELRRLNLESMGGVDVSVIPLGRLKYLDLVSHRAVDLAPLHEARQLHHLYIDMPGPIDLTPLAGREGLWIAVPHNVAVIGADRLAPSSRVTTMGPSRLPSASAPVSYDRAGYGVRLAQAPVRVWRGRPSRP